MKRRVTAGRKWNLVLTAVSVTEFVATSFDETSAKKRKLGLEFSEFEDDDIEDQNSGDEVKTEIDLYKKEPILGREHDPCVWWKKKCDKYPLLSKLAKKYLCVPATSVESESVFSSLGLLLTKRRLSMTGDNVNRQLFKDKLLKQS